MAENKKYYWLKLYEEFFKQPAIKLLKKSPEGDKIQVIYLKLLLMGLRTDGFINLEGLLMNKEEELALSLDEEPMDVQLAVGILEKVKLLERSDGNQDWDYCMTKFPEMVGIGSETAAASRMRAMRERKTLSAAETKALPSGDQASQSYTGVTRCYEPVRTCYTEIEKEVEIEKDKEIESEKKADAEVRTEAEQTPATGTYGVSQNVILSSAELESLKRQFPDYLGKIDYLSSYMTATGKKYDSHYLTIVQWARQDELKRPRQEPKRPAFEDYSFKEGESL